MVANFFTSVKNKTIKFKEYFQLIHPVYINQHKRLSSAIKIGTSKWSYTSVFSTDKLCNYAINLKISYNWKRKGFLKKRYNYFTFKKGFIHAVYKE